MENFAYDPGADNRRIILMFGSTETLGYFSKQIGAAFSSMGREVFYWDLSRPAGTREAFDELPDKTESILITFNFLGLCGEGQCECGLTNIWDRYDIEKIVIMVDSPIYYYRQLSSHMKNLRLVCIDRNHAEYIRRWHREYGDPAFIPLCGNYPVNDLWTGPGISAADVKDENHRGNISPIMGDFSLKPVAERKIGLVFIANYVPFDSLAPALEKAGPAYREFMLDVADNLIKHPDLVLEDELYRRLKLEFPDEEPERYPEAMFHMIFIDLYIRTHFRGQLIRTIADAGLDVYLAGKDWEKLECIHPEKLHSTGRMMNSAECLCALEDSRVSLNIMPWFKAGAHDRIFSSMLAGCAAVTDSSGYLDEILHEDLDHIRFDLSRMDELPGKLEDLLCDGDRMQDMADRGRKLARGGHTWKHFALELVRSFQL